MTSYEILGERSVTEEFLNLTAARSLVIRVLGYRSGDPGSIPGTTREKKK
jgi:hypothetical protein